MDFKEKNVKEAIKKIIEKNDHLFESCKIDFKEDEGCNFNIPINYPLFEILITNLLSNSVQHNNSKEPKVDINFSSCKDEINIQVKDNGYGLDKRNLKNIFKKFFKVGKSPKGSGLGLYIATLIVKIHKGSIKAESQGIGKGTVFTVTLPYKK